MTELSPRLKTSDKAGTLALTQAKFLDKNQCHHLDRYLKNNFHADKRNVLLIYLAWKTGARASEILELTLDNFEDSIGAIRFNTLKGGDPRELPVPKWLYKELKKLRVGDDGRLFPISYNRLYQIWNLYAPRGKKFHSLRHTFAIELYARTKDLRLVQLALGHRNIQNTMIYADYYYKRNEFRKLIVDEEQKLFPRSDKGKPKPRRPRE